MTEKCPLCKTERVSDEPCCRNLKCGYPFPLPEEPDPSAPSWLSQGMDSYVKQEKGNDVEQQPAESQIEPSYVQSDAEWEKNKEAMADTERSPVDDVTPEEQGILVLPDGKEISFENNQKTVGRSDVSQFVELETDSDPRRVSNQQFTIWREFITSLTSNPTFLYFIEDRATSVQAKASTNGTKVNGEKITEQLKKELHHDDKIEFARIPECVATFKIKTSGGSPNSPRIQTS